MKFKNVQLQCQHDHWQTTKLALALASTAWGGPTIACRVVGRFVYRTHTFEAAENDAPKNLKSTDRSTIRS